MLKAISKNMLGLLSIACCGGALAHCFDEAANRYGVSARLLRSIAQHESGMRSQIVVTNTNGSRDIGLMGINTIHLEPGEALHQAGFQLEHLKDPCTNVMVGAFLLKRKVLKYGFTWKAVGAYHSETPEYSARYQQKIWEVAHRVR